MTKCDICQNEYRNVGAHKNRAHVISEKDTNSTPSMQPDTSTTSTGPLVDLTKSETTASLLAKIEALEAKDIQNQERLKLLYEVADKGRILNYESKQSGKKPLKVKLSVYDDCIIIGWRTIKDNLIKNPTTGKTVGEEQEYELLLLDKDSRPQKGIINGYPKFSEVRYAQRIECEVVGKKEDFEGNVTFSVVLPDGREIDVSGKFVN